MPGGVAAWGPDGTELLVVSKEGGGICPIDEPTRSIEFALPGDEFFAGEFSADGKHILATSLNKFVGIVDAAGKPVAILQAPADEIFMHAHFLPGGLRVVTGSSNGTIRVWDAANDWKFMKLFDGGPSIVKFVVSPTGADVLAVFTDEIVRRFSVDEPGAPIEMRRDVELSGPVRVSPDCSRVVVGYADGQIRLYPLDSQDDPVILPAHSVEVKSLEYAPTSLFLATSAADRTIRIWSQGSFLELHGHRSIPEELVWSSDGQRLATASYFEETIKVWRTAALTEGPRKLAWYTSVVTASIHAEKRLVLAMPPGGNVTLHQLPQVNPPILEQYLERGITDIAVSPNGERFFGKTYGDAEMIYVYSLVEETPPIALHVAGEKPHFLAVWSPDSQRIATTSKFGRVGIFKADGSEPPVVLRGYEESIGVLEWTPDSANVLAACIDGKLRSYRADGTGNPEVLRENILIGCMKLNALGNRLAIATNDGMVGILNADGVGDFMTLGKVKRPRDILWSKNSGYIAQSTWDNRIIVFSTCGQKPPLRFDTHAEVTSFAFTNDNRQLLVILRDGSMHSWQLVIDDLQEALRNAHADCVPPDMRSMFLGESEALAQYKFELQESQYGRMPPPQGPPPEN